MLGFPWARADGVFQTGSVLMLPFPCDHQFSVHPSRKGYVCRLLIEVYVRSRLLVSCKQVDSS